MKNKTLIKWMVVGATVPASVFAQTTTPDKDTTDIGKVSATGTSTATADNTPSATGVTRKEPGGGLIVDEDVPKSKSSVTRDFIQKQAPSADVFQILKYSPGATTGTGDAYGLNQGVIAVRGLQGSQMGFNFEGMPLSVVSNWSVFPGEWIDTENTDVVTLNQGTPDLASPNVNATGGVVDLFLHNPSHEAGGLVDMSYGTDDARREFVRLESGDIGDTGLRGFISFSNIDANHFRGEGEDKKQHVDMGIVKDWGGGSSTKLALTYSEIVRDTYKNPTLAEYSQDRGFGSASNYAASYAAGGTSYYALLKNPWRNLLVSMPSTFVVNPALRVTFTPYVYYGYGASGDASLMNESAVGYGDTVQPVDLNRNGTTTDTNVLVYTPYIESTVREGTTLKGEYTIGNNDIVAGAWFEHSQDHLYQPYSYTNGTTPLDYSGSSDQIRLSNGQVITGLNRNTIDDSGALFFGDTLSYLGDSLKISAGLKELWLRRVGNDLEPNPDPRDEVVHMATLPTFAVSFKPAERHQFFASVTESYGLLPENSLYPYYYNGTQTTKANPHQPGESSTSFELGYRYQGPYFTSSTTLFRYDFKNRQISSSICDPGCLSEPINGGRQMGEGVDFELGMQPIHNFRPYVSFEYLHTEIEDNIQTGTSYLPTAGKEAVESPRMQAAFAVDYDTGRYFANLGVKYVGSQYSTFMNDEKIPSYMTMDGTLGMRFANTAFLKKPEIRLNMLNLLNRHYLSGVYSATTNARTTEALDGSSVAGSAPTYLVGNGVTAMVTFATAF
ncbi:MULTISPECIES: TonB-dependent receptor [Paraburkholderia]|uniref:Iron complex outermembrane recepter protein n=1 Tax=Paraburkholderia phenazinium TaxID=60549 RepID=A0A1N6J0C2_9BURK|nr:TonB-dependent receptor [Paraburkholderia phenazinium]SIO37687.1 iron complex outermembrane recepter protein [Paraburkholderia phenazinium]